MDPTGSARLGGYRLASLLASAIGIGRPPRPGASRLEGLEAAVTVELDARAMPHLVAGSARDLFRAQGFMHGQDRGFQMDLARRFAAGSLAELVGEAALPYDRFLRQMDFRRHATAALAILPEQHRSWLAAYVEGVNQAWQTAPPAPEYRLLRQRPKPWREVDTLLVSYQLAWTLNTVWQTKWAVDQLTGQPEALALLFGQGPLRETILPGTGPARSLGSAGVGSNNWVVSAQRTKTGGPLLANDPHLAPQLPSIWYQMWLEGGGFSVAGATLAGAPGVIIGQNQSIGWGLTNVNPDVQDLYRIQTEADGESYLVDGAVHRLGRRQEHLAVRGRPDETLTCWDSIWGPVIYEEPAAKVALAWTALQPLPVLSAVLKLNLAQDWTACQTALEDWWVPAQNLVYADRWGHIGYVLAGQLLAKPADWPVGVLDGNSRRHAWPGRVPMAKTPRLFDPPSGLIVTANNPVVGADHPVPVPGSFSAGGRARRIRQLLEASDRHDAESFGRIQMDVLSEPMLAVSRRLAEEEALPAGWHDALINFDGMVRAEAVAPTLCHLFAQHAVPEPLGQLLARPFFPAVEPGPPDTHPFPERWWSLAGEEMLPWLLAHWPADPGRVLQAADQDGRRWFGADHSSWRWGEAHQAVAFHPLGEVALTRPLFGRRALAMPGDEATVLQAAFSLDASLPWPRRVLVMPSYRQVLDLAERAHSTAVHLTGQSGHCRSAHYDDLFASWREGIRFPLGPGMAVASRLTLLPAAER